MKKQDMDRLVEEAGPALKDDRLTTVVISVADLMMVVSALQLALRHPGYPERSRDHVESITFQFQHHIVDLHPGAKDLLDLGWDPSADEPLD